MRLGLIGCGIIGAMRAQAVAEIPGFPLVAVADVDAARARAVADRFRAPVETDWKVVWILAGSTRGFPHSPPFEIPTSFHGHRPVSPGRYR